MSKNNKDLAMQLVNGIDAKDLGPKLLEAAQDSFRADTQKVVLEGIKGIIRDVEQSKRVIAEHQARVDKQNQRLEALQKGKFTIQMGDYNTGGGPRVQFDDEELRGL